LTPLFLITTPLSNLTQMTVAAKPFQLDQVGTRPWYVFPPLHYQIYLVCCTSIESWYWKWLKALHCLIPSTDHTHRSPVGDKSGRIFWTILRESSYNFVSPSWRCSEKRCHFFQVSNDVLHPLYRHSLQTSLRHVQYLSLLFNLPPSSLLLTHTHTCTYSMLPSPKKKTTWRMKKSSKNSWA